MNRIAACLLTLTIWASPLASAQPVATPEPVVTVTIDPQRVIVGQKATLVVTVLAPNYMPAPPALPDFQVRNVVTRPLGAINQVEQREGVSYAGVRYEFALFPQEPGNFAIAGEKIGVTYAAEPPQTRTTTIEVPRLVFEGFIPEAAQDLDPFIAAPRLTIEQSMTRSAQDLKVGDSVTRTVTLKADGTPAMLLPPVTFARVDGLTLYPAQPTLNENLDRRTSALSATRVDDATYMLEKPGDYTLPAIEFAWLNVSTGKIEHASADAIALHVADNPALRASGLIEADVAGWNWQAPVDFALDHRLLLSVILVVLAVGAWYAPTTARSIRQDLARRQLAYLNSEAWSFARLRASFHQGDPEKMYLALLGWLERFVPQAPFHTIEALKRAARDPLLDHEIASFETNLFGPRRNASSWSPRRLLSRISRARRRLLRSSSSITFQKPLIDALNPTTAYAQTSKWQRPVAR
ncbi:MAG TPA: BatD family protein [Pseudolabrys sp.]|nr:BatD family protein [Pseudolabrys sp.]